MARPREFDIDEALDKAMNAFWIKGYEATSMIDLMEAMKLNKGSIYKAFGDKHTLFIRTLETYIDRIYASFKEVLIKSANPKEGLQNLLTVVIVEFAAGKSQRKGCYKNNCLVERGPHDVKVRKILIRQNDRIEKLLSKYIAQGQSDGYFRNDLKPEDIALGVNIMIAGMMSDCKAGIDKSRTLKIAKTYLKTIKS